MSAAGKMWMTLMAWVYPRRAVCMGCGSAAGCEQDWICDGCRERLADNWVGAAPPPEDCPVDGAAFAYLYQGPAGGLVRNLKYRGVHRLARVMAEDMVRACRGLEPMGVEMVVSVPMYPRRERQRGLNQSEVLARQVAVQMGAPFFRALRRVKNTRQQARLSPEARRRNLTGAFSADASVSGRRVLLVDDVCTTGATARACAEALRDGGAAAVFLVCYALAGK